MPLLSLLLREPLSFSFLLAHCCSDAACARCASLDETSPRRHWVSPSKKHHQRRGAISDDGAQSSAFKGLWGALVTPPNETRLIKLLAMIGHAGARGIAQGGVSVPKVLYLQLGRHWHFKDRGQGRDMKPAASHVSARLLGTSLQRRRGLGSSLPSLKHAQAT